MLIIIIIWALCLLPVPLAAETLHEYTVRIDPGLQSIDVEARFTEPVRRLYARDRDASRYLLRASDCESDRDLDTSRGQLVLPGRGSRCLRYRFDLERAARADRRNHALAADNVIVSPSLWLWRPYDRAALDIRFDVDDSVRVSVPWQPIAKHRYRLGKSPRSGSAVSAFGNFHYSEPAVANARLRVAILKPDREIDADGLEGWLVDTATNISLSYGRFPHPSPQILVIPTPSWGNSPVSFGRVLRDGGESVELFINPTRPIDEFVGDWTATHEFSHLMLPYVTIRQRWVSEGFAQYYQNVLLARAGIYDEQRAWQKLYEGLERGRRSRPDMSPNAASQTRASGALMKIYWSGAAMIMMADIELRHRSGGLESLDTVLVDLQRCCLPSPRVWTAEEHFLKLDELVGDPVFMPLYRRYADAPGFPDYLDTFDSLGLTVRRNTVYLDDNAELAGLRDAITATPISTLSGASGANKPPALR